jgi:hypothetical protein
MKDAKYWVILLEAGRPVAMTPRLDQEDREDFA